VPSARAKARATIALLWLLLAAVPLVCLELLGFALTKVVPDLYDQRQPFLESLQADDLERFKQSVASNTLGWDNPASDARRIRSTIASPALRSAATSVQSLRSFRPISRTTPAA
jgi:hypothetical protein